MKKRQCKKEQDKYTMDPGQSNSSQQSENNFQQKVIFEKNNRKPKNYA